METEELLNPYTKDILIQVTEHAKKELQDQIKMFEENSGTMYDMQVKLAQGIYKVLEKMGFCLGVLMADQPTRHQKVLEQICQDVLEYFEEFKVKFDFQKIRAGNGNLNYSPSHREKKLEELILKEREKSEKEREDRIKAEAEKRKFELKLLELEE